ncbi:phosphoribulokinase [Planobispora rosea]|uniref:Phosphoribulokinase n=1 Tax=Planobispora rosea TaxID=35762 RepID=A0A8J3S2I0_PLARO|nr:phosphoribulokinase [Planobispora rosea]GGS78325.1 phosphoribulokinase [Planobispora rosea]GIH85650.1 phosphoribulokinase [Planobispora rosea]
MPHKLMRIHRAESFRPAMLAIAGDSAAGKTTVARGLTEALGEERSTMVCVDDYHRYERAERSGLPFTPLHPACNHIQIMEQHLQLLAMGQPILKPVYDHRDGSLARPRLVEPRDLVIVEGLLPLHSKLARACFDVTVYLDPPEWARREWKVTRDTDRRGYTPAQVLAELSRRETDSAGFVRPQRREADIVVRFTPVEGREGGPLSATLLLRPTIRHPDFARILSCATGLAAHLTLTRDCDGGPVDALHVHGDADPLEADVVAKAIWHDLGVPEPLPGRLGLMPDGSRNEPLRITQLILLYHLIRAGVWRLPGE